MPETYTQPGGNTPQGQSTNSLAQALATITGMAPTSLPSVTPQQVGSAQATASQFSGQEPQQIAQATQSLQQQAGIPQLQGQQQNLGKIFELYLHDQNLAQKYQGAQLSTPTSPIYGNASLTPQKGIYTGETSSVQNPYLAAPSALINAVTQPSGQGFQGFTSPNLITQAMGEVPQASSNMINLLQEALGQQKQLVAGKSGEFTQAYESQANLLQKIADIFTGVYQSQQAAKSGGIGGFGQGSVGEAASAFSDILDKVQAAKGGEATEYDIWNYINQHQSLYKDEGINVNELWKLHKDLVDKVGKGGSISAGTKAAGKLQLKKLPDGTMANYNPTTGKLTDAKTGKPITATSDQLKAAQEIADAADSMMENYQKAGTLRYLPGAQYFSPDVAQAQSTMYQTLGALRKEAIGGRITQTEVGWLTQNLFPSPYDTPQVMQSKVDNLKKAVSKLLSDPASHVNPDGSVTSDSEGRWH